VAVVDKYELDNEAFRSANPAAVIVSVSPFGRTGPRRGWLGGELLAFHTGGIGYETPRPGLRDLDTQQPLKAPGYQGSFSAGWLAALAAMTALFQRETTGRGQSVDVSEQEAMVSHVRQNVTRLSYEGEVNMRKVTPPGSDPSALGPCKDGLFSGPALGQTERDWFRLCALLGNPDWAQDPSLKTPEGRLTQRDMIHRRIAAWKLQWTRAELFQLMQEVGAIGVPQNTVAETYTSQQLVDRQVFTTVDHPVVGSVLVPRPPWVADDGIPEILGPAPMLGEHNEAVLGTARCAALRAAHAL
jgi:crotonobetainyl-CoA:carnitine CoA-transferase CaiB-like acyl-CoA transferase